MDEARTSPPFSDLQRDSENFTRDFSLSELGPAEGKGPVLILTKGLNDIGTRSRTRKITVSDSEQIYTLTYIAIILPEGIGSLIKAMQRLNCKFCECAPEILYKTSEIRCCRKSTRITYRFTSAKNITCRTIPEGLRVEML